MKREGGKGGNARQLRYFSMQKTSERLFSFVVHSAMGLGVKNGIAIRFVPFLGLIESFLFRASRMLRDPQFCLCMTFASRISPARTLWLPHPTILN